MLSGKKGTSFNRDKLFTGWASSFEMCSGAAGKDGGQKIDSHHTSDVLSEHITITQTHIHTYTHTLTLNERADESDSLPSGHEKKAICGRETGL